MLQRLPWPKEPAQFEELCRALWASMDKARAWERLGRSGQEQHGLDVVGNRAGERWLGIQCKVRDAFLGSTVTTGHIDEWVAKARDGEKQSGQRLAKLVIATTAPNDTAVQTHVKKIGDASVAAKSFAIEYWSWDRLETALFEDAHKEVLAQFFAQFGFRTDRRERIVTYLRGIVPDLQKLPLRVLRDGGMAKGKEPTLAQIYTTLDVDGVVSEHGPMLAEGDAQTLARERWAERARWTLPGSHQEAGELVSRMHHEAARARQNNRKAEGGYSRPATILEAAAVNPRLVITGVGGSGKSTFLRYLALCLAGENLRYAQRDATAGLRELCGNDPTRWTHGMLVPLWIELRDFARSKEFPANASQATRARLWAYLAQRTSGAVSDQLRSDLEDLMAERHAVPGVLLVLDGVDELTDRAQQTPLLLDVLADFLREHPRSRVLLTARPYAVDDAAIAQSLHDLDFTTTKLAPPSDAMLATFLPAWFEHTRGDASLAKPMLRDVRARPQLREILRTPLIVTLVADLHGAEGCNWNNPAELFEAAVRRLVDRWNSNRDIPGAADFKPHEAAIRRALEGLAWQVQCDIAVQQRDGERWFDRHLLENHLKAQQLDEQHLPKVSRYLEQRCGILECDSAGQFRFPHRNLLEFLAAVHAAQGIDHPLPLLTQAQRNLGDWREVLLFAGALGARGQGVAGWTLLDHAVPELPPAGLRADDPRFALIAVCAQMVVENRMLEPKRTNDRAKLERLRAWLKACLTLGALSPPERAAVGRHLALVGDDRKGVGLDAQGLPDIDWVTVEMPKRKRLDVARYPITNAQFAAFVADGGYTEKWDACWSEAGLAWRKKQGMTGPDDSSGEPFSLPNHPRVNVTLHEAIAFAAWLAKRLQREVRLPTGDERKFAGCGKEGRSWAWGNDYGDGTRSNGDDAKIGSTCAVGMFPSGVTPDFGLHDMSGNVWEWATEDGDAKGEQGGRFWGGSWRDDADYLRTVFDYDNDPDRRYGLLGFRVVAPASR